MECDVIPTSLQEIDPLGTVEHCNGLDEDSVLYSQPLNPPLNADADDENTISKTRKIINIAPTKSRKLLNIRSSTSPPVSHTTTVTDSNLLYRSVSHCLSFVY